MNEKIPTNFIPKKFPVCPQCGSKNITARLSTKTFWCRRCMHVGGREEFFKIQDLYKDVKVNKKNK